MTPFISELKTLLLMYSYNNKVIPLELRSIICDAPARNSCLATKSYNGYFGCGKCTQEGDYINHRMTFQNIEFTKRTNESFRTQLQPEHHIGNSPFLDLNINMITHFPLDYLHTLCLGVVKKFVALFLFGNARSQIRPLPSRDIDKISERLNLISKLQPSEFQRKCRQLKEFHHFKGTEFRNLILYILPVVCFNVLPNDMYNNMLHLHAASLILVDPNLCKTHSSLAQKLLQTFVCSFRDIFGPEHVVYNVHSLLHMVDDVKLFGSLDSYSAFPFENFMCSVKRMLNGQNNTLAQICNRIEESYLINYNKPTESIGIVLKSKEVSPMSPTYYIYREIVFPNFVLKNNIRIHGF